MKLPSLSLRLVAGLAVCLGSGASFALSLGAAEGPVTIGRPLEVDVRVVLDPGQAEAPCVQAEVFYGAQRVNPSRVSADAGGGQLGTVKVRSTATVNDPVVTMTLQVGCGTHVARRYVLLAAQAPREPGRDAALLGQAEPGSVAPVSVAPAALPAPSVVPAADLPAAAPARQRAVPATQRPARPRAQPVPRLEVPQPVEERQPVLRMTGTLLVAEGSEGKRAAAAALWRALNSSPEDLLREGQRLQALQSEVQALRQAVRSHEASASDLREQVRRAEREPDLSPVFLGLAGLALALAASTALLWSRARRRNEPKRSWWRRSARPPETDFGSSSLPPGRPRSRSTGPRVSGMPAETDPALALAAAFREPPTRPGAPVLRDEFHGSQPASLRSVTVEEVHDPNTSFFHSVQADSNGFDPGLDINLDEAGSPAATGNMIDFEDPSVTTQQLKPQAPSRKP